MKLRQTSIVTASFVLFASVVYPQTPATNADDDTPVFRVQVWGHIVEEAS